jgi:hypothetical protein
LSVGDVLFAISEAGLLLTASKTDDILKVYPAENITPDLAAAIKEHKSEIIRIMREDEEKRPAPAASSASARCSRWPASSSAKTGGEDRRERYSEVDVPSLF